MNQTSSAGLDTGVPSNAPTAEKSVDLTAVSIPDTLAALHVNADIGLTRLDVENRRKEYGYNEVAEKKRHPVLQFLGKFWGISAWMLELIMFLSAVLRNFSDLAVVGALLVVNAGLGFAQEHRAAGVVDALRRRLQVSARVRRESSWQVVAARELVPGDIVRVRSGDIVPADVKMLTGALSVDQSALTGESKDADKTPGEVLLSSSWPAPMDSPRSIQDFAKISLATDHVRSSKKPETWNIGGFVTVSVVLGVAMVAETLLLLWMGWSNFGLGTDNNALHTFSFLMLLYFGVFSVVSARERRWFWATLPSKTFVWAVAADAVIGTVLTLVGLPGLTPLPWWQTLTVLVYAMVACLMLNDALKVVMIKWRVPTAIA